MSQTNKSITVIEATVPSCAVRQERSDKTPAEDCQVPEPALHECGIMQIIIKPPKGCEWLSVQIPNSR